MKAVGEHQHRLQGPSSMFILTGDVRGISNEGVSGGTEDMRGVSGGMGDMRRVLGGTEHMRWYREAQRI